MGRGFRVATDPYYTMAYLNDRLGTTAALSDGSGNGLHATLGTDAFGVPLSRYDEPGAVPTSTPSGFAGGWGYADEGGGLHLLGHRWYDADAGRFLTRDPAREGRNWWAYCGNDPANAVDPTGLTIRLVGFDKDEAESVRQDIEMMKKSKYYNVRRMIWSLILDKKDHIITLAEDRKNSNANSKGNVVRYAPWDHSNSNYDGDNNASIPYDPEIVLAHELGHQYGYRDPGDGDRFAIRYKMQKDPYDVIYNIENPFRLERGLALRLWWNSKGG